MKVCSLIFLSLILMCGCQKASTTKPSDSLTISAAASLKDAFGEIAVLFESKNGKKVHFNFGASGALQKQIETGSPVDIFASAGEKQMNDLAGKGLVETASRRDFARNQLVLILPADSKININSFSELTHPEIKRIAIGESKTVPVGQYTEQVFDKLNLKNVLQTKLIPAQDVRQVLDYVGRGEVEAGIVYATDAKIAGDKVRIGATAASDSHDPILYPIAIIRDSSNKEEAREFIRFLLSAEGQNILQKYGFLTVSTK
jgi:molybdate transport system substrate-binding protein